MLEINIIKFTSQKPNYCKPRKVYLGKKNEAPVVFGFEHNGCLMLFAMTVWELTACDSSLVNNNY